MPEETESWPLLPNCQDFASPLRGLKYALGGFDSQFGLWLSSTQMRPELIKCVVFDFAGTLCSCPYFRPLGPAFLDLVTEKIFGKSSDQWADPWMRGDLSSREVAAYLSGLSGLTEDAILNGLQKGCRSLRFNPAVYEFAKAQKRAGRKTVLATLNMDVFSQIVVPSHSLSSVFDVIVNTSDLGTLKKEVLWQEAFRRLGDEINFPNSLLIDDSPQMVSMFRDLGGVAYRYTNDSEFQNWLAGNEFH